MTEILDRIQACLPPGYTLHADAAPVEDWPEYLLMFTVMRGDGANSGCSIVFHRTALTLDISWSAGTSFGFLPSKLAIDDTAAIREGIDQVLAMAAKEAGAVS